MKPTKTILTAGPSITEKEISYVTDAVTHGWNGNWAGYLNRFEAAFAAYTGSKYAMATSSCTGGLHLSLLGLGVGPGDEVIVPEITWVATASAVKYTGATPVFVDVHADTWCMDTDKVEAAITPRTKVIVPVHIYGHPVDMDAVLAVAKKHGLRVMEDAAPALGATVRGRQVGGIGDIACFSFQGAKIMTTGEGGMIVSSDPELMDRVKFLADHGRDPVIPFLIREVGYKYKMSNIQAALGLAQVERIEELVGKKREIFGWYRDRLADVPGLALNAERPWARNICWMSSVVLPDGAPRADVMAGLKARGVDSRPFFPPVSSFPMFENREDRNPVAYRLGRQGVNLPSGHNLTEGEVDYVCEALREVLAAVAGPRRQAA